MRVELTEPAVDDLTGIRDYIARDSEFYAGRFIERIIEAVEKLSDFPEMGRRVPEAEDQEGVREILFQNYRIIYRIKPEKVQVLSILYGSRDLAHREPKPWGVS